MLSLIVWSQLILLIYLGGLFVGIRNERKSIARLYTAIKELRARPQYRRSRNRVGR